MRVLTVGLLLLAGLWATPGLAVEIDGCHPPCGAPGDLVYVQGKGFSDPPVVTLQGHRADVVRCGREALVCRVPSGLEEGPVPFPCRLGYRRDRYGGASDVASSSSAAASASGSWPSTNRADHRRYWWSRC